MYASARCSYLETTSLHPNTNITSCIFTEKKLQCEGPEGPTEAGFLMWQQHKHWSMRGSLLMDYLVAIQQKSKAKSTRWQKNESNMEQDISGQPKNFRTIIRTNRQTHYLLKLCDTAINTTCQLTKRNCFRWCSIVSIHHALPCYFPSFRNSLHSSTKYRCRQEICMIGTQTNMEESEEGGFWTEELGWAKTKWGVLMHLGMKIQKWVQSSNRKWFTRTSLYRHEVNFIRRWDFGCHTSTNRKGFSENMAQETQTYKPQRMWDTQTYHLTWCQVHIHDSTKTAHNAHFYCL